MMILGNKSVIQEAKRSMVHNWRKLGSVGISEAETKDTIEKINKVSNCLLEKLIKLIAPARTIEKNRDNTNH